MTGTIAVFDFETCFFFKVFFRDKGARVFLLGSSSFSRSLREGGGGARGTSKTQTLAAAREQKSGERKATSENSQTRRSAHRRRRSQVIYHRPPDPQNFSKTLFKRPGDKKNYLTLSGYAPTTVPVSAMAFLTDPASLNSTNANLIAELGSPQTRQSTICPAREKSAASSASVTVPSMSQT